MQTSVFRYFSKQQVPTSQNNKELDFLSFAGKLKMELRHSYLANGRPESVAEHSWRLGLMAFRYAGRLKNQLNVEKCLKLALVHDLAEAKTGDIPVLACQSAEDIKNKQLNEQQAMQELKENLGDVHAEEMYDLWLEYENQQTIESQFIKALDKLEAFIQHNEADLSTWEPREKRMLFQDKWLRKYCQFDPFLAEFCEAVISQGIAKLQLAGEDIATIAQAARDEELGEMPHPTPSL